VSGTVYGIEGLSGSEFFYREDMDMMITLSPYKIGRIKVKGKVSLYLTEYHIMKMYREVVV
jgi:hypothetical protein